jgi:hypothetical protein
LGFAYYYSIINARVEFILAGKTIILYDVLWSTLQLNMRYVPFFAELLLIAVIRPRPPLHAAHAAPSSSHEQQRNVDAAAVVVDGDGDGGGGDGGRRRPPPPPSPFVIAGYLPDYRDYVDVNESAVLLTDVMLFSLTPESIFLRYPSSSGGGMTGGGAGGTGGTGGGGCCLSSRHYDKIRKARSHGREQRRRRRRRRTNTVDDDDDDDDEGIRILVTIGGGGRSEGFRDVVSGTRQFQRRFIGGMVQLW